MRLGKLADRLNALERMHRSLGYEATLERGFAVVRDGEAVVTRSGRGGGAALEIQFRDGRVRVKAEGVAAKRTAQKPKTDQGSLF